ncbi:MAG TPA: ABC transporter ATP-binding protein [Rickettsiales bacterium]|nr:ABC transporter ATP-binding protein [Rickettsiales bacterium]
MFNYSNSYQTVPLLKRLVRQYIAGHRTFIIIAIICMLVVAGTNATNAYLMKPMLDDLFIKKDERMLLYIPIAVFLVGVINAMATYGQTLIMRNVGQRIISDMQIDLFAHLMKADLAVFHDQASGRLISRFTNDIMLMRNAVSTVLTGIARDFFSMLFLIGLMFYQDFQLALIAFVAFPIAILPIIRLGRRMRKLSDSTQQQLGHFAAQLDETFQGVRMVKAYGREDYEISRANAIIENLYSLYFRSSRVQALASPIMGMLTSVTMAFVIWYGGYNVLHGTTTPGTFSLFITAMLMAYKPAKTLATLNNSLQEGMAAADRLFAVLDMKPHISDAPEAEMLKVSGGAIRFENASFNYSPEVCAINDITLDVPSGKTVALVGASGSGKSTMINLLLRFYDLNRGMITVDNQDIRDVTLSSLRNAMSLVSQEIVLFDATVRANIAYGRLDASDDEIVQAAKMAAADDFIRELPQGYDTMIGPHGVKLSGGQRQRLAIARAMVKNAPILLLDEATSALDNTSERIVQEALEKLMHNRTTLVVAHRLSTIRNADIIYVLDQGRITESGSHDELMKMNGFYYNLYASAESREQFIV